MFHVLDHDGGQTLVAIKFDILRQRDDILNQAAQFIYLCIGIGRFCCNQDVDPRGDDTSTTI